MPDFKKLDKADERLVTVLLKHQRVLRRQRAARNTDRAIVRLSAAVMPGLDRKHSGEKRLFSNMLRRSGDAHGRMALRGGALQWSMLQIASALRQLGLLEK